MRLPEECPDEAERPDSPSIRNRQFLVAPHFGGMELLRAEYRRHRFSPHAQDTAVIGVAERGTAKVYGTHDELVMTPGSVLVIPPGVLHEAHSLADDWHYRAFYLTAQQLLALGCRPTVGRGPLGTRPYVLHSSAIASDVFAVHTSLSADGSMEADVKPALTRLLASLAEPEDERTAMALSANLIAAGIARVRALIDADPLTRRTISDMAREAGLARFTFAHAFSRAYGISPHAYAMQRKVAAVRDLLATGEQVSRVAHRVGFADQSHLTRRFLSVVGVTPGEFRRAWQDRRRAV